MKEFRNCRFADTSLSDSGIMPGCLNSNIKAVYNITATEASIAVYNMEACKVCKFHKYKKRKKKKGLRRKQVEALAYFNAYAKEPNPLLNDIPFKPCEPGQQSPCQTETPMPEFLTRKLTWHD